MLNKYVYFVIVEAKLWLRPYAYLDINHSSLLRNHVDNNLNEKVTKDN